MALCSFSGLLDNPVAPKYAIGGKFRWPQFGVAFYKKLSALKKTLKTIASLPTSVGMMAVARLTGSVSISGRPMIGKGCRI
jgi:hypothetical protein